MDNRKDTLRNNLTVYIVIWLLFIIVFTLNLSRINAMTMPMLFLYVIYYFGLLNFESRKTIKYMKAKHNDVWKNINAPLSSNIFKWYKILGKYSQNEELQIVKKHLNGLVALHALHLMSFLIVPQLLRILQ